jgi:hypothetical protein
MPRSIRAARQAACRRSRRSRPARRRLAQQLGDRGLAVGAGHGAEAVRQQPPGELELADDRQPPLAGDRDRWSLGGHAGALDHAAHALERLDRVPIQDHFDAGPGKTFRARRTRCVDPDHPLAAGGQ